MHIAALRKALGEDHADPWITTNIPGLPRMGEAVGDKHLLVHRIVVVILTRGSKSVKLRMGSLLIRFF